MAKGQLIILDRDGVLNELIIDRAHQRALSPLVPSEVEVRPETPRILKALQDRGYRLAIATNQPGAAKGETTRDNLEKVHGRVVELCEAEGARFSGHYICWHRAEDGCECRKPKAGLLLQALKDLAVLPSDSWMVGDRWIDIQAGLTAGTRTCFLEEPNPYAHLEPGQAEQITKIVPYLKDFYEALR